MKTMYKLLSAAVVGLTAMETMAGPSPADRASWLLLLFMPIFFIPPGLLFIFLILKFYLKKEIGKTFLKTTALFTFSYLLAFLTFNNPFVVALMIMARGNIFASFFWTTLLVQLFSWWLLFRKQKNLMTALIMFSVAYALITTLIYRLLVF